MKINEMTISSNKQVTLEDLRHIRGGQDEEIAITVKANVSYKNGGFEASVEVES
jgi:hypothetical protein